MTETVQSLIAPDNHWALLAILFASTFLAIWLEQKYRWASKMSGAIITLVIAIALVNLHVIPAEAAVFDDIVWGYAVPLAIPLLLIRTNLRKMHREAGRFLAILSALPERWPARSWLPCCWAARWKDSPASAR